MSASAALPRVLVIDDQFGRWALGTSFRSAVGEEVFAQYVADCDNLCLNFGLARDGEETPDPVALATFSAAQKWDGVGRRIVNDPDSAIAAVQAGWPFRDGSRWALVLLDLRFTFGELNVFGDPELGSTLGSDVLLPRLRSEFGADLPVVVLSSTPRDAVNARVRELGALDFIQRIPGAGAPPGESRGQLRQALAVHGLFPDPSGKITGGSLPTLMMIRSARRAAQTARTILLDGETGTGKGLLARFIHEASPRRTGPFEVFNAAQRSPELQADEIFGHWRGAFTDAASDAAGMWERANGGTLFIDEVADLDETVQLRLMQPIEERTVRRIGSPPKGVPLEVSLDVLTILATNRKLSASPAIKKDFLNRIDAFVIEIPSLRERQEDVPILVGALVRGLRPAWKGRVLPGAMAALRRHEWRRGNVRELRNVLERALTNNPGQDITLEDLGLEGERAEFVARDLAVAPAVAVAAYKALQQRPVGSLLVEELSRARVETAGFLPRLVAEAIAWALEVTATGDKLNHTAAVRLLLGREDVTGMEAKRFLTKVLSLDARGGSVWASFEGLPSRPKSPLLGSIIGALTQRSAPGPREGGNAGTGGKRE